MSFANPWGLLGLLALPVIVAIHLYHRRFPPLIVSGLHLWGAETQMRTAGRRRDRLPITASLLLELLAALLLSLALSQPRFGESGQVAHLVVVLDNSASMMAAPAGEPSFRDAAIKELQARANALPRGSLFSLILTGRRPVMLAGPAVSWREAEEALEQWQPTAPQHEFQSGWDLAAQLASETGQLLFLTDHLPKQDVPVPREMEIVSVGRGLDNLAIATARWNFDPQTNRGQLFLRVRNFGRNQAEVTVRGTAREQTVFERRMTLAARAAAPLEAEVPGGLGQLTLELDAPRDPLAIDNTVTLVEPKVRMLNIAQTLPDDSAAARLVCRVLDSFPDIQSSDPENANLIIGPADALPPSRRDLWWLGIGPLDRSDDARENAKDLIGPYLLEKRNPLLDGVVLGGVVWGGVQPIDFDVSPLITAGSYPLLSRLNGTQTTAYLMNIDFTRSNLSESPDWPILLSNLVALRRDNLPGLRRWNYRLNEEIRFRLFEGEAASSGRNDELLLVHNDRTRPLAPLAVVEVPPLQETGIYEIRYADRSLGQFAVNFFDADESNLLSLAPGVREPVIDSEPLSFALDRPYTWLLMLAILLILIAVLMNWYVLKHDPVHS